MPVAAWLTACGSATQLQLTFHARVASKVKDFQARRVAAQAVQPCLPAACVNSKVQRSGWEHILQVQVS